VATTEEPITEERSAQLARLGLDGQNKASMGRVLATGSIAEATERADGTMEATTRAAVWPPHSLCGARYPQKPGWIAPVPSRASIAVSADRQQYFLFNASPDIQSHIESFEARVKE